MRQNLKINLMKMWKHSKDADADKNVSLSHLNKRKVI